MNKGILVGGTLGLLVLAGMVGYRLAGPSQDPRLETVRAGERAAEPFSQPGLVAPDAQVAATQPAGAAGESSAMDGTQTGESGAAPTVPWLQVPADDGGKGAAGSTGIALSKAERRQKRAQVREKLMQLRALGPKATIEDVRQVMADVERISDGVLDPHFIRSTRALVDEAARAEALSVEFRKVAQSQKPQDVARQKAILAELREVGHRMSTASRSLQAYTGHVETGGKP